MLRRLELVLDLRPGELGRGILLFGYLFFVIGSFTVGKAVRDALFIEEFGAMLLPYADIAIAEGQCLGTPFQYGGPYLGILACRKEYVRKMPGRLVGQTVDRHVNRCWVLTLQTREQHIRREKATSNICTNQGLLALRAAVYLAAVGPQGLKETAELCYHKAHYAAERLKAVGAKLRFNRPFFK